MMTVNELITKLSSYPKDAVVHIQSKWDNPVDAEEISRASMKNDIGVYNWSPEPDDLRTIAVLIS